jgi:hypothetical protein
MRFGAMARVLSTQKPDVYPALLPEDLPRQGDEGMEGLTAEYINSLRVSAICAHATEVREARDDQPKLFYTILSRMGVASLSSNDRGG